MVKIWSSFSRIIPRDLVGRCCRKFWKKIGGLLQNDYGWLLERPFAVWRRVEYMEKTGMHWEGMRLDVIFKFIWFVSSGHLVKLLIIPEYNAYVIYTVAIVKLGIPHFHISPLSLFSDHVSFMLFCLDDTGTARLTVHQHFHRLVDNMSVLYLRCLSWNARLIEIRINNSPLWRKRRQTTLESVLNKSRNVGVNGLCFQITFYHPCSPRKKEEMWRTAEPEVVIRL